MWIILLVLFTAPAPSLGQIAQPNTQYGRYSYVVYHPGTINLILSVPHGGFMRPGLPYRSPGCHNGTQCVYDLYSCYGEVDDRCTIVSQPEIQTAAFVRAVLPELEAQLGGVPHVIVNKLTPTNMDPNAPEEAGAQGVWDAIFAYRDYHNFTLKALDAIKGSGLFLDIHTHNHESELLELGYDITADDLDTGDYSVTDTTIKSLLLRECDWTEWCHEDVLRGQSSLGQHLLEAGLPTVPSLEYPAPKVKVEEYMAGGFNIRQYGSKVYSGSIDAILVNFPEFLMMEDQLFAVKFAQAIAEFMATYYA